MNTVSNQNTTITFKGDFDLGQKTLLNCFLSKFESENEEFIENTLQETEENGGSKLVRRRKSVREKIKAALDDEENL